MKINPRHLLQVRAIDRFRHFGHAADYLGISQPALSRALKSFEQPLGSVLFRGDRAATRFMETVAAMEESVAEEEREPGRRLFGE